MLDFKISKLSDCFGIEISDIDLTNEFNNEDINILKRLFFDNHVIVFRDQKISEQQQLAFTKHFGELEVYPEADKTRDSQKTYHVANVNLDGKHLTDKDEQVIFQKVNQNWHTDSSYRFIPSYASLLYAIEVLPDDAGGGETEFVNMFEVYDSLDNELKIKLEPLHMVHYYEFGRRMFPNLPPVSDFEKENIPPVSHPLIRLHPDRHNSRSLFFTANAGNEIGGMSQEKGSILHKKLVAIVSNSNFKYKHRWKKGDLLMWDNRCLLHRAVSYDTNKYRRALRRTTLAGTSAIKGPFLDPSII